MLTPLDLDDRFVEAARCLSGIDDTTALVYEGLRALIEREPARRLACPGGAEPDVLPVARRRSKGRPE